MSDLAQRDEMFGYAYDQMFGYARWVICYGCPATDQAYAVHHKDYHGKRDQ